MECLFNVNHDHSSMNIKKIFIHIISDGRQSILKTYLHRFLSKISSNSNNKIHIQLQNLESGNHCSVIDILTTTCFCLLVLYIVLGKKVFSTCSMSATSHCESMISNVRKSYDISYCYNNIIIDVPSRTKKKQIDCLINMINT